jgi:hypothetical protein
VGKTAILTAGSLFCRGGEPSAWEASVCALFAWLISHQPAVLFSHNKPATSNQPAVLLSQNKLAPAISHQPTEQAAGSGQPKRTVMKEIDEALEKLSMGK